MSIHPDDWPRARETFERALELPPAERAAYLASACGSHQELRREVERMLASYDRAPGFLATPAAALLHDTSGEPWLEGQRIGPYQISSRIGAGGMGEVYKARDTRLDRTVAIKVLPSHATDDPHARDRFDREARAIAALNHPHICALYDVGEATVPIGSPGTGKPTATIRYLVMEHLQGETLAARLLRGPLSISETLHYAVQMASALDKAHRAGIVHRDLKPANVMLVKADAKLLDFGLAKQKVGWQREAAHTRSAGADAELTTPGTILGTVQYMAPEQLEGREADARTDVFAFGAVLYEMLTGSKAFTGATQANVSAAILEREPVPLTSLLPSVPPAFDRIVKKCLAKDPEARWQSTADLSSELQWVEHSSGDELKPPHTSADSAAGRRTVNRLAWGASALVGLAIAAALAVGLMPRRQPTEVPPSGKIAIAVLPFRALAVSQPIQFLGVGIPDAIISRLASVQQLALRPTMAVLKYENGSVDPRDAGRALASDYVVTGILQEAGDRLGLSVQLVRVLDGAPVWGDQYDVARSNLLALQDQIAQAVAEALKVQMTAAERERLFRKYTENAAAYERYLKGRAEFHTYTAQSVRASIVAFEEALKLDPDYALARAGVALSSAIMRLRFAPTAEHPMWMERAEREARAALKLDPQLAEAHEALAAVYRAVDFDWDKTLEESGLALALNPNLDQPHLYRAAAFYHLGLLDLIEPALQAAAAGMSPANQPPDNLVESERIRAITLLLSGRFQEAVPAFEGVKRLSNSTTYDYLLGLAYYYAGNPARAEEILARLPSNTTADRRAQAVLASLLAARHANAEARVLLKTILDSGYMDHHIAYSLGATYAQLGELTEAHKWLAEAARIGLPCYPWTARDPLLDPLRRDPEFRQALSRLETAWRAMAARYGARSSQ